MININFPSPSFKIKTEAGKEFIFDALRKKWLLLTPEEWVRQNLVQFLQTDLKYPAALIALEKEIKLGELKKRFDILIYDANHNPWMMIECKAAAIKMDEKVLQQVLRYNISIPVKFIIITNGSVTYGWKKEQHNLNLIAAFPDWES